MTMRILITGSREWADIDTMRQVLMRIPAGSILCHGAARGADTMAGEILEELCFHVVPYPVDMKVDGRWPEAGKNRNTRMLADFKPDRYLAFPTEGSRGTWDMVRKCRAAGVPGEIIESGA